MSTIAVVANQKKTLGGGLDELRSLLASYGFHDPLWYEAPNSRTAATLALRAVEDGADVIFVWGGDGTVQRCINEVAGHAVDIAILPAGTANLLALNLGIPVDLRAAVETGLFGGRRRIDVGVLNGERFAVMAGVGFDGYVMKFADAGSKSRFGHLAYAWAGFRSMRIDSQKVRVKVDGEKWFKGRASCVLLGQMGTIMGGVTIFPEAQSDDGLLEVGVVTARNVRQWARVFARVIFDHPVRSPFTEMTRGSQVTVKFDRAMPYELDGGARKATRVARASVQPGALNVCVPGGNRRE